MANGRGRANNYTTGEVASLLGVAPKTVSKWFDSGRLKGWRLAGSTDRRVPRASLVEFLREHGMPVPPELSPVAVVVGFAEPEERSVCSSLSREGGMPTAGAATLADLFVLFWDLHPSHVIADADRVGVAELASLARAALSRWPRCVLACTRPDDGQGVGRLESAGWRVVERPVTTAGVLGDG